MSLELYSAEVKALDALWQAWETKRDYELESTFRSLDYTSLLGIIQHLRSLGMQEITNPVRLDIFVANGLRFTIEGEDIIQKYCKDNVLNGKAFSVMLKEKKRGGTTEVDIKEYGFRVKLRHELILHEDDARVQDALRKWATLPKAFRYINRVSLQNKGFQFDCSFVRENKKDSRGSFLQATTFGAAQIPKQDVKYEMEIEALRSESPLQKSFLAACVTVLRGLQKSYTLVRQSVKNDVIRFMSSKTEMTLRQDKGRLLGFPGAKPVTLHKENIGPEIEADFTNIRLGDYNVTDKADGLRCLLVVYTNGKIYLIDQNLNVYGTDRVLPDGQNAGLILDGEWVTHKKDGAVVSHYYAFDIFNGLRGEDVTMLPFVSREGKVGRHGVLADAIALLTTAQSLPGGPGKFKLSIFMKAFRWSANSKDPLGIFQESSAILDRVQRDDAPYNTDGLIFTPNADPLPKNGRTWPKQFKWKPASMNSVDFLVLTEKVLSSDGKPTNTDNIQYIDRDGTLVQCKTLRLFVGSSVDPVRIDPRDTILQKKPLPPMDRSIPYRPVEFSVIPADPLASICRVEVTADDTILCDETRDPINDRTIVEMVYKPEHPPGWRWIPMRVRWDKTELLGRGEVTRTMNDMVVATDVWNSIHDPITERMIRTGSMVDESPIVAKPVAYYKRKTGDRYMLGDMTRFHNQYIKDRILLSSVLHPGDALLDMSVGRAGDLHKWLAAKVGWVLGCDISLQGLIERDGAYDRYLTQSINRKGQVPKMIFVQADSSLPYTDGSAGISELDQGILQCLWGECGAGTPPAVADLEGKAAEGFDVAASMFALHYFFKDLASLDGVLANLAASVKLGGYFVGCCTDGDEVSALLKSYGKGESVSGTEGDKVLWKIVKQYEDSAGFLPADESGLGRGIDVNFLSIGETHTEYLMSWEYLKRRLSRIGFELLNEEELRSLKLTYSTNLFKESFEMAKRQGLNYGIPSSLQTFSFLNRWFIFRRRGAGSEPALVEPTQEQTQEPKQEQEPEVVPVKQTGGGTTVSFYHKSKPKDDLKIGEKNWKRVLSTFAPFTYNDVENPSVTYSSLEAALGSARLQYASDRPELGPQIFSTTGDLHQATLASKEKDMDEEGALMRQKQKPGELKKLGAKFAKKDWLSNLDKVLDGYVNQRYARDEQFKKIMDAVREQSIVLTYFGGEELGGEENRLGKAYGRIL